MFIQSQTYQTITAQDDALCSQCESMPTSRSSSAGNVGFLHQHGILCESDNIALAVDNCLIKCCFIQVMAHISHYNHMLPDSPVDTEVVHHMSPCILSADLSEQEQSRTRRISKIFSSLQLKGASMFSGHVIQFQ